MKVNISNPALFKRIAKHWNERINQANDIKDLQAGYKSTEDTNVELDIGRYKCCILGEIHGFKAVYPRVDEDGTEVSDDCSLCTRAAQDLAKSIDQKDLDEFEYDINSLIDHLEYGHPDLIQ